MQFELSTNPGATVGHGADKPTVCCLLSQASPTITKHFPFPSYYMATKIPCHGFPNAEHSLPMHVIALSTDIHTDVRY